MVHSWRRSRGRNVEPVWRAREIDEAQLDTLLMELAAEGGRIQQAAETIASWRAERANY